VRRSCGRKSTKRSTQEKETTWVRWQDVCETCLSYDYPDHPHACKHCKASGITEGMLCMLTRDDQEGEPHDFECSNYRPKHVVN